VIIELFIMSRLEQDPRSEKNHILLCVSDRRVRATNKDGSVSSLVSILIEFDIVHEPPKEHKVDKLVT